MFPGTHDASREGRHHDTDTDAYKLNRHSADADAYEVYAEADKGVETGDKTNLLESIVAFLAGGGIIAYLLGKKKRKNG